MSSNNNIADLLRDAHGCSHVGRCKVSRWLVREAAIRIDELEHLQQSHKQIVGSENEEIQSLTRERDALLRALSNALDFGRPLEGANDKSPWHKARKIYDHYVIDRELFGG